MFDAIKKIFGKSSEKRAKSTITLAELPSWLDEQEENCIFRRTEAAKKSRERLLSLEQELHQLLTEFGDESSDEPHHHKVEQVNRHALPQFCRRIESELEGDFSDDDEVFYREVASLIDGCFKAYKGPGRYLHHLYPEEVKIFRQTLDQMGQELNRMTEVIRISRERLSRISGIRDILQERDAMQDESSRRGEEEKGYEVQVSDLTTELERSEAELEIITSSEAYTTYQHLLTEGERLREQVDLTRESLESQIRIALPVWKRAAKIFQEQGKSEDEKQMEDLIHLASAPRRDDDELSKRVSVSSKALFVLLNSETLHAKNSFEKSLLTTPDEYSKKIGDLCNTVHSLSDELEDKKQELDKSTVFEKKTTLEHHIEDLSRKIETLNQEEKGRTERLSSLKERQESSLQALREKFLILTDEEIDVIIPEEGS